MATDEGAEKGQGSKPCIVSLAPLSRGVPSLSLPPSAIRSPEPPAHLHTFINTVCCPVLSGKRLRCTAYSQRYPCSYCSSCIPSNHICKLFMLCPGTGACRGCASASNIYAPTIWSSLCVFLHICVCVVVCTPVCYQDKTRPPIPPPPVGIPSSPFMPPPIPITPHPPLTHTHTHTSPTLPV